MERILAAHRNVLIGGPTGVGKSFIACALGNSAARAGYTVLYTRAPRLLETLQQARGDGSHLKALTRLGKVQLLIIDDFLLTPLADWERRDLLELVEERYGSGSTVVTSQCPIVDWHPNIGDLTLADSICDRLLHNAYRIELRGESMRRRQAGAVKESLEGGNLTRAPDLDTVVAVPSEREEPWQLHRPFQRPFTRPSTRRTWRSP